MEAHNTGSKKGTTTWTPGILNWQISQWQINMFRMELLIHFSYDFDNNLIFINIKKN